MSDEELDEYDDSDSKQISKLNTDPSMEEQLVKYGNKILATTPIDELYVLQEQVSEYLGVKSFKRKYPGNLKLKLFLYFFLFKKFRYFSTIDRS